MATLNPQLQTYRDCYAACRSQGGTIQACQESCNALAGTNQCDPCCGLWQCFGLENRRTLQTVTGAIVQYGPFAGFGIAAAAVGIIILIALVRP